jgi:hypothetical protein
MLDKASYRRCGQRPRRRVCWDAGHATPTDSERDAPRSITAILDRWKELLMQTNPAGTEPENGSGSKPPDDQLPTASSHANPITRTRILTSGYITRHPTLLKVLKGLGWNNPGGSMNP